MAKIAYATRDATLTFLAVDKTNEASNVNNYKPLVSPFEEEEDPKVASKRKIMEMLQSSQNASGKMQTMGNKISDVMKMQSVSEKIPDWLKVPPSRFCTMDDLVDFSSQNYD